MGDTAILREVVTTLSGREGPRYSWYVPELQMGGAYAVRLDGRLGWRTGHSGDVRILCSQRVGVGRRAHGGDDRRTLPWARPRDACPGRSSPCNWFFGYGWCGPIRCPGMRRPHENRSGSSHRKRRRIVTTGVAIIAAAAIAAGISLYNKSTDSTVPLPVQLPTTPQSYLGVYADGPRAGTAG